MLGVDPTIQGHPALTLDAREPVVITVCAECGQMRSVLWLDNDRWYCRSCRAEGVTAPNYYPVS